MNDGLVDAFRHNAWATRELLAVCAGLTPDQLATGLIGTQGTISEMLWHTVSSDASYCRRLTGKEPSFDRRTDDPPSVAAMSAYNDELEGRWLAFLATPFDAERTFVIPWDDGVDRDVPAGVILAQALHHANEHRSQVATILTQIGVTPPEWGVWEFAAATGRAPVHRG